MPATALDVAELTTALVRIPSITGAEAEVIGAVEQLLSERGWHTGRIAVSAGRDDLLATSTDSPLVTLSTHLDTVPPFIPPRDEGDRLYGRGSCDAKGIAAAMICAAERLRDQQVPIALLFVVGEETTHDGAAAANALSMSSRVLVNGEPTESRLATGTKGALRVSVRTAGRAAHSAYPELGHSATAELVQLLSTLDHVSMPEDPLLGTTTINIGALAGGVADNVVAPWAEARLMIRLVSSAEEVEQRLKSWAGSRASLEFESLVPPVRLNTLPGFETTVVAFATDIPRLTNWGQPYLFGPGSVHVAHTDGEYVSRTELARAVDAYERLALAALEREKPHPAQRARVTH